MNKGEEEEDDKGSSRDNDDDRQKRKDTKTRTRVIKRKGKYEYGKIKKSRDKRSRQQEADQSCGHVGAWLKEHSLMLSPNQRLLTVNMCKSFSFALTADKNKQNRRSTLILQKCQWFTEKWLVNAKL